MGREALLKGTTLSCHIFTLRFLQKKKPNHFSPTNLYWRCFAMFNILFPKLLITAPHFSWLAAFPPQHHLQFTGFFACKKTLLEFQTARLMRRHRSSEPAYSQGVLVVKLTVFSVISPCQKHPQSEFQLTLNGIICRQRMFDSQGVLVGGCTDTS